MTLLRENITILDSNKNKDALESNYNFERKRAQKYFSFNVATISVNEVQLHKYNINHFPAVAILFKRKYVNTMWLNVQHNSTWIVPSCDALMKSRTSSRSMPFIPRSSAKNLGNYWDFKNLLFAQIN